MASNNPINYASYISYVNDPISEAQYQSISESIASQIGSGDPSDVEWSMRARHLFYYLKTIPHYVNGVATVASDCPSGGVNLPNLGSINALSTAGKVDSTIGGIAAGAGQAAAAAVSTGSSLATGIATIAPIVTGIAAIVAIPLAIIGLIEAEHAQAVATEQKTLCSSTTSANTILDSIDQAFYSGAITIDQANSDLGQLLQSFTQSVQSIRKACNAACYMVGEMMGQVQIRALLYAAFNAAKEAPGTSGGVSGGEGELLLIAGAAIAAVELS